MKSKQPSSSDRGFGQLSLPSSFQFKSLSGDSSKEEGQTKPSKKNDNPSISLSDFLNRKLSRNSIQSKTVQRKQKPFSSLLGITAGSVQEQIGTKRCRGAGEVDLVLDETVFKQFNYPKREKEEYGESGGAAELEEVSTTPTEQDLMKQRNPFRVSSKDTTPKHLLVLGDDPKPKPKPKQKRRQENFIRNKKPKPLFNHYANGSGWWDCDMEGVDSEEVGCNEVWEGMGSTTLGGLEWH
ncbi:hypothetical protein BVC80_9073g19 [Macleaya cordata]|uniref:Uncharacterized protein n=1 Tax=Macleaya cordata TaxID=56857 RepID=A0A200PTR3_MACCD|nr:hypothetical protein BVC80_9073g19 [Macleaya cordata]